jgi:hypothetical protein
MVRDLEDAPRDSVAVVVDVEASEVVGPPGRSSLDDAARAAAGLLRAHVVRSRSALLVVASPQPGVHRIRSLGRDWDAALDALAAAEPVSGAPLHELLTRGVLATVPDLVVLTGRPAAVADAVVARQAVGRASALVVLDTPTYAGRPPSQASAVLLRLSAAGVPIAVVRLGDSLLEALTGLRERAVG